MSDRKHAFHCPACDERGTIELPDKFLTFSCPAECGARFAKYQASVGWAVRCVVQPVYRIVSDMTKDRKSKGERNGYSENC